MIVFPNKSVDNEVNIRSTCHKKAKGKRQIMRSKTIFCMKIVVHTLQHNKILNNINITNIINNNININNINIIKANIM